MHAGVPLMRDYFETIAADLDAATMSAWPGAFFSGPSGGRPISMGLSGVLARYVRLSLTEVQYLHLSKVRIIVEGEDGHHVECTPIALRTSSVYAESASLLTSGLLWNELPSKYGFHTEQEREPWAELDLGSDLRVCHIQVFNRDDGYHERAYTLRIDLRSEAGAVTRVFDHLEHLRLAAGHVEATAHLRARQPTQGQATQLLCRAYAQGLRRDFPAMQQLVDSSPIPGEQREAIRKALNASILPKQSRFWNKHGIRRTFRFWTDIEKRSYLEFANQIARLLRQLSPNVCLGFGAVLGAVRDRGFIPHDDDLDIIIGFDRSECPSISEGLRRVRELMTKSGYSVRDSNFPTHHQVFKDGGKSLDIFVGLREGDRISWYPQPRGSSAMEDMFPPIPVKLSGIDCPMPRNPFRYLEAVYGPKWGTSNSRWGHKWDKVPYQDIL
jgi:hypothetical protein